MHMHACKLTDNKEAEVSKVIGKNIKVLERGEQKNTFTEGADISDTSDAGNEKSWLDKGRKSE